MESFFYMSIRPRMELSHGTQPCLSPFESEPVSGSQQYSDIVVYCRGDLESHSFKAVLEQILVLASAYGLISLLDPSLRPQF